MSDPVQPKHRTPPPPASELQDDLINTPINIARARHASAYNPSVIDRGQPDLAQPKTQRSRKGSPTPAKVAPALIRGNWLNDSQSCLFISLLSLAFIVGGVLGGVIGGGMLLWASNASGLAFLIGPPTATPLPTPTPAPVATLTPTPTPQPVVTPTIEDIIAGVIPSVVTVINQQNDGFSSRANPGEGRVVGSGVIVDERGYIATNNHVINRPGELSILLADGREAVAELVAANPAEDLAILKINLPDLQPVTWGASAKVRPGQIVYAIGSPLGDFPGSVSLGIISGLNRALEIDKFVIDGLMQTDAAINRGSSGGPLINLEGQVIGINTFIIRESEERGIAEGIAFSIPADTARGLLIPWIAAHTGESVPIPVSEETK
jgi:S1-C subfamily serine protease